MVTSPGVDPTAPPADAHVVRGAATAAGAAARRAGVTVRPLVDMETLERASLLAAEVWRSPDTRALEASLMRALEHSGNFVVGAFEGDDLVGLSVGFRTGVPARGLHSHMTCTDSRHRGGGLGYALKMHQRAWALSEGLQSVTWTFDPLVGRNAYFNMAKLGAAVESYLPNFYGAMTDGLNAGDESDRLLVVWDLATPVVDASAQEFVPRGDDLLLAVAADGTPVRREAHGERVGCQLPGDVMSLRAADPGLARRWRHELRTALGGALGEGYRVAGFSRAGYYVLDRSSGRTGISAAGG